MATFVQLEDAGEGFTPVPRNDAQKVWVNLDHVQQFRGSPDVTTTLWFGGEYQLRVHGSPEAVAKLASQSRQG